jgi:hypothetical protein
MAVATRNTRAKPDTELLKLADSLLAVGIGLRGVLDQLASHGLVLVSSHNLVLATLLAHRLVPLRVTAPGGDELRLVLEPGVLAHTNGIALLAAGGFGAGVESNAAKVFDWLSA